MLHLVCMAAWCAVCAAGASEAGPWRLVFQDDFERAELGEAWLTNDAAIVGGRMLLGRKGPACAKLARPFPGDVRIEFSACAFEGRPPCDLSVVLAAERLSAMSWNYLLAFGGVNNTTNKLTGGRALTGTYDEHPTRLIEPGRTYRLEARKEGRCITLDVDGVRLLEGVDAEIMGGPAFDAVGVLTWNGMYVDDVRVYERVTAHPDTPVYLQALEGLALDRAPDGTLAARGNPPRAVIEALGACNRRDFAAAERAFLALDGEIAAAGLAYLYGDLYYDEKPEDFPRVARLFTDLARTNPGDARLAAYARAAALAARVRVWPRDPDACTLLASLGPAHNPFYAKAKLYRARFLRANGLEGANRELLDKAHAMFTELKTAAPDHHLLRQLTGERLPWGEELICKDARAPVWAALLRELYARQLAVLTWWFTVRQFPDGQLGGGWGDDVEILRTWGPLAMVSDAVPAVREGIARLAEGVWTHVLVDGFDREFGDVEHSAEPSADTLPVMMGIRHGDPMWYERNLASCRRIRDVYTGIDANGYVRFKSAHFGGDRAGTQLQEGGDNYYCSRPMKHFLWAAWYGNEDARKFYLNWVEGWVAATMRRAYTKPAGMPPANIWFPSGDIAPPNGAPWYDRDLNYMGCCWPANFWLQDTFISGYCLSRDRFFLGPFRAFMAWQRAALPAGAEPRLEQDPEAWAIEQAKGGLMPQTLAYWRAITGDDSCDTEIVPRLGPAQRFQLTGNLAALTGELARAVEGLRVNFDMHTREVLQTDRAGLAGSALTFGAYTGAVREWGDAGVPLMAVTWDVHGVDLAALVTHASPTHIGVRAYNFRPEPLRAGMRCWSLVPGTYEVRVNARAGLGGAAGENGERPPSRFALRARADACTVELPPGVECEIDVRCLQEAPRPAVLPDPAIARRDVVRTPGGGVSVTVHNLGSEKVTGLIVALRAGARELARSTLDLPAYASLVPATAAAVFPDTALPGAFEAVLDPDDDIAELCEANNAARAAAR